MTSNELRLLISSIKVSILGEDRNNFLALLNSNELDWDRINLLANYHEIVPVFYNACKLVGFSNEHVKALEADVMRQAIKNVFYEKELLRLLTLLANSGIPTVPYKGMLFLEKLYNSRPVRK